MSHPSARLLAECRAGHLCRADFPILQQLYHNKPLAFLDNGASTQKPRKVISAMTRCLESQYANVHRGAYELSLLCTEASEALRDRVAERLNLPDERNYSGARANVVFVRGTTEAINLVAQSWGRRFMAPGDIVVITDLDHHANIVPWHMLAEEKAIELRWIPVRPADGRIDLPRALEMIESLGSTGRLKLVAFPHVSNVLGTIQPVHQLTRAAQAHGARVLIDGAQAVAHLHVDVAEINPDFYAFSGHKMYGPTGIGILYGRAELLEAMPAWQGGGDMIMEVRHDGWRPNDIPYKFEAGTPAFVEEIGLVAAFDYLDELGPVTALRAHELELIDHTIQGLATMPGVRVLGPEAGASDRSGVVSFVVDEIHPHDIATILDMEAVCVRAGHHCAQPLMKTLGIDASTRASFAAYNTLDDVEQFLAAMHHALRLFGIDPS